MPSLTVTEKEHWKDRIGRRIDKKIETLEAIDPNLTDRIDREARQQALASLGLAEMQAELDRIKQETEALRRRENQIEREMIAHVRGVPVDVLETYYGHSAKCEVESAVQRRKAVFEDELLAATEIGRKILQLKSEREELLDTVWLATSPTQVRQLWIKVGELLGEGQTRLQHDALAIEPITD